MRRARLSQRSNLLETRRLLSDRSWIWSKVKVKESEVAQPCPTLSNPMDPSLLGSSVHGIFQARILEWVAFSFSRGSSQPRDLPHCRQTLLPSEPPGKPLVSFPCGLSGKKKKNSPAMWETWVHSLGWEDPLEKEKATHSSLLAWRIPWTVQFMGSQRVGHN